MAGHWSLAFSYRLRLTPEVGEDGALRLVVPSDALRMVGTTAEDEFVCVVGPNGNVNIRKVDQIS